MNELDSLLKVEVDNNDKKHFEFYSDKMVTIKEIKKRCQQEFKYSNEDINNIILWSIDDDKGKHIINNDNDLLEYSKELEPWKY